MRLFIPTLLCLLSGTANADTPVDGQDDNRFGGGTSGIASVEFNLTLDPYDEARSLLRMSNGKLVMLNGKFPRLTAKEGHKQLAETLAMLRTL